MSVHVRRASASAAMTAVLLAAGLTGCTQGRWSPTSDAVVSARTRGTLERSSIAAAPRSATRSLVLAEDNYGRLANVPLHNASNTTMTAGVETGE